ncbi:MAG: carbohydrate porin [Gammaproteobacteria bacterium]|nr:carbohydrate porin [Gammaproteobacteria bacterium]
MKQTYRYTLTLIAGFFFNQPGATYATTFGGPDTVENTIEEDTKPTSAFVRERVLDPWFKWKEELARDSGLSFGVDYTGVYLGASESLGDDAASGGMVRFFGSWDLIGRGSKNTGAFVWKVEHRHAYGDNAPSGYGFGSLGYVGFIAPPWSDQGSRFTNFYWRQRFNEGKTTYIGGYIDITDYADTFVGGSPWTAFANLAFSAGSASMFLPNDATLGMAAATMLTDNVYVIGGITNAYADSTSPFKESFDRFFNDNEYFTSLEIGWTKGQDKIFLDNTHLTFWHVDDSIQAGAIEGWGVAFSHASYIDDKWMPFIRGGYADDGGSLLQKSVGAGFLYQKDPGADLLGLGVNWGEVNESSFSTGLDDQITVEAFYRFQLTQQIAITPSLEYISNPALNPEEDNLWVLGLRLRIAL